MESNPPNYHYCRHERCHTQTLNSKAQQPLLKNLIHQNDIKYLTKGRKYTMYCIRVSHDQCAENGLTFTLGQSHQLFLFLFPLIPWYRNIISRVLWENRSFNPILYLEVSDFKKIVNINLIVLKNKLKWRVKIINTT